MLLLCYLKGVCLILVGEWFLCYVQYVMMLIDCVVVVVQEELEQIFGYVWIGMIEIILVYLMLVLMFVIFWCFGNFGVSIVESECEVIEMMLVDDCFDIVLLLVLNIVEVVDFKYEMILCLLCWLWIYLVYLLQDVYCVIFEDVVCENYLLFDMDEYLCIVGKYWGSYGIVLNVWMQSKLIEVVRSFVVFGYGVMIFLDFVYWLWLLEGNWISCCNFSVMVLMMDVGVVWWWGGVMLMLCCVLLELFWLWRKMVGQGIGLLCDVYQLF